MTAGWCLSAVQQGIAINDKEPVDNDNKPMPGLYVTGDMSGSFRPTTILPDGRWLWVAPRPLP